LLYLQNVVPFVPDDSITIDELRVPVGLSASDVQFYTRFMGLDRVASARGLSVLDMLLQVGADALAGVDRSRVRYLIHAHTIQLISPPAFRLVGSLRDKLGLGGARSFAMAHQNCVTGLYALRVAEALLSAEPPGSLALILAGEKVCGPDMRQIPRTTVLGDAAAACVVGLDGPGDRVLSLAQRTLGRFHESFTMSARLQQEYKQAYIPAMASVMREAVDAAGLGMDEISLVLPHNVNRYIWAGTARYLGLPLDRVYLDNIPKTGHCFCADPFVNLSTARAEGAVKPGDTVLLVAAGLGATFCAAAVRTAGEEH
jgi:3-oxoacyl-[acyl-carrier-protein] synthase III